MCFKLWKKKVRLIAFATALVFCLSIYIPVHAEEGTTEDTPDVESEWDGWDEEAQEDAWLVYLSTDWNEFPGLVFPGINAGFFLDVGVADSKFWEGTGLETVYYTAFGMPGGDSKGVLGEIQEKYENGMLTDYNGSFAPAEYQGILWACMYYAWYMDESEAFTGMYGRNGENKGYDVNAIRNAVGYSENDICNYQIFHNKNYNCPSQYDSMYKTLKKIISNEKKINRLFEGQYRVDLYDNTPALSLLVEEMFFPGITEYLTEVWSQGSDVDAEYYKLHEEEIKKCSNKGVTCSKWAIGSDEESIFSDNVIDTGYPLAGWVERDYIKYKHSKGQQFVYESWNDQWENDLGYSSIGMIQDTATKDSANFRTPGGAFRFEYKASKGISHQTTQH